MSTRPPLRLEDCDDTLTADELCRVLKISRTQYYELRRHRALRIKPLPGLGVARYAKVAVEEYLASSKSSVAPLRRVS